MRAQTTKRPPGLRFEAPAPALPEILPRMDIAAFVGFAARGPLHTPVVVEDVGAFAGIFGDDLVLARDETRGEDAFAHLGPAVRSFFRNGGVRCWVVRVADENTARNDEFPLPGLVSVSGSLISSPAKARARSKGTDSAGVRVTAEVLSEPIHVIDPPRDSSTFIVDSSNRPATGDLLRLTYSAGVTEKFVVMFATASASPSAGFAGGIEVTTRGTPWLIIDLLPVVTTPPTSAQLAFDASPPALFSVSNTKFDVPTRVLTFDLPISEDAAPDPGSVIKLTGATLNDLWITIDSVDTLPGLTPSVRIKGRGLARMSQGQGFVLPPDASLSKVERLTLVLTVRRDGADPVRLAGLGFVPGHPRYWGDLPVDETLYRLDDNAPTPPSIWEEIRRLRFPLAGPANSPDFTFPVADSLAPAADLGASPTTLSRLDRNGLTTFGADLFLSPSLRDTGVAALLGEVAAIQVNDRGITRFRGIHALLDLDEVSLIAVPDAVQSGWEPFSDTAGGQAITVFDPAPLAASTNSEFKDRLPRTIVVPTLDATGDPGSHLVVSWAAPLDKKLAFTLQESHGADFADAIDLYRGTARSVELFGKVPDVYFYRVHVEQDGVSGEWSNTAGVQIALPPGVRLKKPLPQSSPTLLSVQKALLRMCAARGDLFAVLALPEPSREDDAISSLGALRSSLAGESFALRFGAVYHPWLIGRDEGRGGDLLRVPPEGSACGVLARRTLDTGAWIAPANQPLRGVVDLTPVLSADRQADLFNAQLNIFRREPRGFLAMSADTLDNDPDQRPINVRRLLSLLRRLAIRDGALYVFEPNDNAFRRRVQRGFEDLLTRMFAMGAFAGSRPAEAFQVVVNAGLMSDRIGDEGIFLVELRVAPSLPLTFLTLRLIQTGARGTVTEG